MTDHLAKAKDYIAKGDNFYAKAADEIIAWLDEDAGRTHGQAAEKLGKTHSWVGKLVRARTLCDSDITQVDWGSGSNRRDEIVGKALVDPERRREALSSLSSEQVEAVVEDARGVVLDRAGARREEHADTDRREIREEFEPNNLWADNLIVRLHNNALELRGWIQRKGGLLLNMEPRQAVDYLLEAEQLIADARAAAQEQVQDRSEVG